MPVNQCRPLPGRTEWQPCRDLSFRAEAPPCAPDPLRPGTAPCSSVSSKGSLVVLDLGVFSPRWPELVPSARVSSHLPMAVWWVDTCSRRPQDPARPPDHLHSAVSSHWQAAWASGSVKSSLWSTAMPPCTGQQEL